MKKIFKGIGVAVVLIVATLSMSHARTAYVSDMLILTFREGPGTNYAVIKTLRSNVPLTILSEDDPGYYKVQLESGEQGWVDKQFITFDPPKTLIIQQLEKEKADLEKQLEEIKETSGRFQENLAAEKSATQESLSALHSRIGQLDQVNKDLTAQLKETQTELSNLKTASEDVVSTIEASKALAAENQKLTQALTKMENEHSHLFRTSMIKWFLAGVGVLLLGWLIGLMLSSRKRRRGSLLD